MPPSLLQATYIGGPTVLLELGGLRFITDPTFDPAGTEYPFPTYTLRKDQSPALTPDEIGHVDIVLLSHDHHADNLDHAGRASLARVGTVLTTPAGAARLASSVHGPSVRGLAPWESETFATPDGRQLRVTSTPARHGPADGDRGPVTGFVLAYTYAPERAAYVSGDTVWYEGVAEVARRVHVEVAILFMGSAVVREVGPSHLTLSSSDGIEAARAFAGAEIVPVHYEGWAHFTERRADIERAFDAAGLASRVRWLPRGETVALGSAA